MVASNVYAPERQAEQRVRMTLITTVPSRAASVADPGSDLEQQLRDACRRLAVGGGA